MTEEDKCEIIEVIRAQYNEVYHEPTKVIEQTIDYLLEILEVIPQEIGYLRLITGVRHRKEAEKGAT